MDFEIFTAIEATRRGKNGRSQNNAQFLPVHTVYRMYRYIPVDAVYVITQLYRYNRDFLVSAIILGNRRRGVCHLRVKF